MQYKPVDFIKLIIIHISICYV